MVNLIAAAMILGLGSLAVRWLIERTSVDGRDFWNLLEQERRLDERDRLDRVRRRVQGQWRQYVHRRTREE